jgi:Arc/MetJ-type ribon-helix-helix transcriptional regulator
VLCRTAIESDRILRRRDLAMTIHLPEDLENHVRSLVERGRFASEDEAVAEAVRAFLKQDQTPTNQPNLGSIGAMRDAADDLDAAVEHAMMVREQRPWRLEPGE